MVLCAATALFARQNKIKYQVDAIFAPLIVNRMLSPVIDFEELAFAHVDGLATYGKPDFVIGDNRQMDTMRVR
jgi:hypothetical protein